MATRSTARAGTVQAGDALDKADDLLGLLGFDTTTDGVRVGDLLRERLANAETAIASHATTEANAILAGDDAQLRHEAEAGRLGRHVERIRLAIATADDRLAAVAEQERRAAGEVAAARAVERATLIEEHIVAYTKAARNVADLLAKIETESLALIRDRDVARAAGVDCDAQLPHEARYRNEVTEEREVIDRHCGPTVTDADGRSLDSKPIQYAETRRRETVVISRRHAPADITKARAALPDVDGGLLLDRGRD